MLAFLWPRTNTVGFVGGVVLASFVGMPIRQVYGELWGTISILAISGATVYLSALLRREDVPEGGSLAVNPGSTSLAAESRAS